MRLLKSTALFLWMLGSSAYLCAFYLQLRNYTHKRQKRKAQMHSQTNRQYDAVLFNQKHASKNDIDISDDMYNDKTQLLEEWEDLIWEYTDIEAL